MNMSFIMDENIKKAVQFAWVFPKLDKVINNFDKKLKLDEVID